TIKLAGEEERRIAVEENRVTAFNVPYITVYVDGGWSTRSYGHSFNGNSGLRRIS
ncbi:hypothetical protein PPYR_01392, partial [Photinus pyralis]